MVEVTKGQTEDSNWAVGHHTGIEKLDIICFNTFVNCIITQFERVNNSLRAVFETFESLDI